MSTLGRLTCALAGIADDMRILCSILAFPFVAIVLSACETPAQPDRPDQVEAQFEDIIADEGSRKRVELESFSVRQPGGTGWQISIDKRRQKVTFSNQVGPKAEIEVFLNTVGHRDPKALSADKVADDFRQHEKDLMWLYGELPGEYSLENVERGEAKIGNKEFYYMTFRQLMNEEKIGYPANVDGIMYLHFSPEFPKPAIFYVLMFKDFYMRDTEKPALKKDQIEEVLESFRPKR